MKTKNQIVKTLSKTRQKLWKTTIISPCSFRTKTQTGKVNKHNAKEALKHFEKLREMIAQRPSPFKGMTEKKVIDKLRQTRKKLWEEKIGTNT